MIEGLGRIGFGLFGLAVLIGITWLFSNNKRAVDWKLVATGITLQIAFAALVILVPGGRDVFDCAGPGLRQGPQLRQRRLGLHLRLVDGHQELRLHLRLPGAADHHLLLGADGRDVPPQRHAGDRARDGLGDHQGDAVSGAETTSVCASVFIGQTEAPLTVRPYIAKMTQSELLTMMIGGMAHIAGGVLAAYVGMLGGGDPAQQAFYAKHLLAASIMAAPATLVVAKLLIPETGTPLTRGTVKMEVEKTSSNIIDAAAAGAGDGLKLALNIGAMLLAFIALIALLNAPLTWFGDVTGLASLIGKPTNLSTIFGYVLAPIAWVIGTPWADATTVGSLIGQKVVINEFVAYTELSQIVNGQLPGVSLSKVALIATYALCGFANFSSIAIQIGGIGGLAPERRHDLAKFGLRAVLGGTIATFMTATIAGVLTHFS
jgi:CNT family concentrative nucleoside transporter